MSRFGQSREYSPRLLSIVELFFFFSQKLRALLMLFMEFGCTTRSMRFLQERERIYADGKRQRVRERERERYETYNKVIAAVYGSGQRHQRSCALDL